MHGQDRNVDLPIKDNVRLEVVKGLRIGADTRSVLKSLQVGVEIQSRLLVERDDFIVIDGIGEQRTVIHAGVEGCVSPGA